MQAPPALQPGSDAAPIVPDTLPQPFLDIARNALRRDPGRRWTIRDIAARLNPAAVGAAAAQSVSPLAVPLSSVPAVPAAKLQVPKFDAPSPRAQAQPPRSQAANPPRQTLVLPNYVVPVAAAILVIVALRALPKALGSRSAAASPSSTASAPPAAQPKPIEQPSRRETPSAPKPSASTATQNSLTAAAEKNPVAQPLSSPVAAPARAAVRTDTFPSANAPSASASSSSHARVLEQILPEVSDKTRATIQASFPSTSS